MRILIRAVAAILTALLVVGVGFTLLGPMLTRTETEQLAYPSGTTRLAVKNGLGEVTVREAAEGEPASISASRTWGLRTATTEVATSGETATLTGRCPGALPDSCRTDWHVVVPAGTTLSIENGVGTIELLDTSGDISARSGVGEVTVVDSRSETIELEVGVGGSEISAAEAPRDVRVRNGVGDVTVAVPTTESYRIRYEGPSGELTNRIGDDPRAQRIIDVQAGVGQVRLEPR